MTTTLQEINSSVAKLRALLAEAKKDLQRIQGLQTSLVEALDGFWQASEIAHLAQSDKYWREVISLVTSGKILSAAAQADEALSAGTTVHAKPWISDGHEYSRWLGRAIADMAVGEKIPMKALVDLLRSSFSLGYTDDLVSEITITMLSQGHSAQFRSLATLLPGFQQRQFLNSVLSLIARRYLPVQSIRHENSTLTFEEKKSISGSIALIHGLIALEQPGFKQALTSWLVRGPSASVNLLRASIAALAADGVEEVLQKCWEQFGDQLHIRHTPVIRQEAIAQILLLSAGYVHRKNPMQVFMIARSSTHTAGVSERIASSSPKTRFLGMVVGMAISQLIDKEGSRMDFDSAEVKTAEALWYLSLVHVEDKIGDIKDLFEPTPEQATPFKPPVPKQIQRRAPAPAKTSGPKIIEILDEDDDDDDDLMTYAKPDSDPEDSDEGATNVQRNKPTAPVYIRDLLTSLENTESYDIHQLALISAAPLIRRKATFGSELLDLLEPLASTLVSLHDTFDTPSFNELRLQALIALLVAEPSRMGPWFAQTYFSGDYSLSQRAVVLSTLGLGARELAGYADEDKAQTETESFPTKRLPDRLHRLYVESSEIEQLAKRLEGTMLSAVSTRRRAGRKMVKNDLAKVVADAFFFPLTGRFEQITRSATSQIHLSPYLLPLYLKTLSFILTAAGPSAAALPSMTSELWTLLLSLRSHAMRSSSSASASASESPLNVLAPSVKTSNSATLEALLFALLSLLTVNTASPSLTQQLARDHVAELLETQNWVQMVFEATRGGEAEGDRLRTLAAGVLVCVEEVAESWRNSMVGGVRGVL